MVVAIEWFLGLAVTVWLAIMSYLIRIQSSVTKDLYGRVIKMRDDAAAEDRRLADRLERMPDIYARRDDVERLREHLRADIANLRNDIRHVNERLDAGFATMKELIKRQHLS